MPPANKLVRTQVGFAAQVAIGKWYVCGHILNTDYYGLGYSASTPTEFPIDDVIEIASGGVSTKDILTNITTLCQTFLYRTSQNICRLSGFVEKTNATGGLISQTGISRNLSNIVKLQDEQATSWCVWLDDSNNLYCINPDGSIRIYANISSIDEPIKTFFYVAGKGCMVLTNTGTLWNVVANNGTATISEINFPYGEIEHIYPTTLSNAFFVLTKDKELYATGNNQNYLLGLPEIKTYSEFEKVGIYDVKKIYSQSQQTYMLLKDGSLWYVGVKIWGITERTEEFTQLLENLTFKDIAGCGGTLLVTIKE